MYKITVSRRRIKPGISRIQRNVTHAIPMFSRNLYSKVLAIIKILDVPTRQRKYLTSFAVITIVLPKLSNIC
jgi:hypothetical protein